MSRSSTSTVNIYIYIYIYIHTHTHTDRQTHIYCVHVTQHSNWKSKSIFKTNFYLKNIILLKINPVKSWYNYIFDWSNNTRASIWQNVYYQTAIKLNKTNTMVVLACP